MSKLLVFLHDSSVVPWNADVEAIRTQLIALKARAVEFQIHNLNQMPREGLEHWKNEACAASMYHHQQIARHFGAASEGERLPEFGKDVPALLVYDKGERVPAAVYPHSEGKGPTRKDFSIEGFLEDLTKTLGDESAPMTTYTQLLRHNMIQPLGRRDSAESLGRQSSVEPI